MTRILLWLLAALTTSVLLELVLPMGDRDGLPWWHRLTGFWAVFGVAACLTLVIVAKALGKLGLQGPEPPPGAEEAAPIDPAEPEEAP